METSPLENLQKSFRGAEKVLLLAASDFEAAGYSDNAREFYALRLQAAIFNYEVARQLVSICTLGSSGLALCVSLKDLVHKLYEYDQSLSKRLVRRLLTLAEKRGMTITSNAVKAERKKWRDEFKILSQWTDVRNQATGHYSDDIGNQVALLKQLDRKQVMDVSKAFLAYTLALNKIMVQVGRHGA